MAEMWASTNKMPEATASTAVSLCGSSGNGVAHILATRGSPGIDKSESEFLCLPPFLL